MSYSETEINDITGFENGDRFQNDDEVREYFTEQNMAEMSSGAWGEPDESIFQDELDEMAAAVIANHWWYVS